MRPTHQGYQVNVIIAYQVRNRSNSYVPRQQQQYQDSNTKQTQDYAVTHTLQDAPWNASCSCSVRLPYQPCWVQFQCLESVSTGRALLEWFLLLAREMGLWSLTSWTQWYLYFTGWVRSPTAPLFQGRLLQQRLCYLGLQKPYCNKPFPESLLMKNPTDEAWVGGLSHKPHHQEWT